MASSEADIRALIDCQREAFRARDIERVMALFAPEVVYFDLVPPLRYSGAEALRARFLHWFDAWASPIEMELADLHIVAGADVGAANMLIRTSGTLKTGREVGYWVRVSDSYRRADAGWLITHEHVSLPIEIATGQAVMDLVP